MSKLISEGAQAVSKAGIERSGDGFAKRDGSEGILEDAFLDDEGTGEREDSRQFFCAFRVDEAGGFPEKA